jgi:hypothetical protein
MSNSKKKKSPYEVLVICHITDSEQVPKDVEAETHIIFGPEIRLSDNEKTLSYEIIRSLDDKYKTLLDNIEIIIRPF